MKNRRNYFRPAVSFLVWPAICLACLGLGQGPAGGTPPGVAFDLQGFIDSELQAGKQRIVVPPGRYRVTPHNRQHLVLRHLKDVTIIGNTAGDCARPGILITSTAGLRLENNTLNLRSDSTSLPALMRQAGLKEASPVVQIQCEP